MDTGSFSLGTGRKIKPKKVRSQPKGMLFKPKYIFYLHKYADKIAMNANIKWKFCYVKNRLKTLQISFIKVCGQ